MSGLSQDNSSVREENAVQVRFLPHISDKIRLIVLAVFVGVLAGSAAALLKWLIQEVVSLLRPLDISNGPDWTMLLLPVMGIMLTGIYQRYILRDSISHGVDKLVNDLAENRYALNPHLTYAPIIASTLTLGFGGSAGSEGPIAYSGAAIGSNIGRLSGISRDDLYILIGCGAAAGIAGIFKAPVGGAMFTLEVLGMSFTTVSVIALFGSAISAAMMAYILSGYSIDIPWNHNITFDPSIMPYILILGVFCGVYSVYYSLVMKRMRKAYESIKNPWIENLVSGAMLAVLIFIFPTLYSEGYDTVGQVLNLDNEAPFMHSLLTGVGGQQWWLLVVLGGVLAVKCFACSASNSGGGVAGDFAPTLFAGCIAGLFFALISNKLLDLSLPLQVFAYVGMAGVMAGVIRAPLMALFLTAEMCNGFDYFLPLITVSLISYGIVMLITRKKFYLPHIHGSHHRRWW